MEKTYTLMQVFINPRDGSTYATAFGEYETLADAKKAAKKNFKLARWMITESKVVATGGGKSVVEA